MKTLLTVIFLCSCISSAEIRKEEGAEEKKPAGIEFDLTSRPILLIH